MQEDKREKVRLPSDELFSGSWHGLARSVYPLVTNEAVVRIQLEEARERARLTLLDLTARDKRFLKAMKVAY